MLQKNKEFYDKIYESSKMHPDVLKSYQEGMKQHLEQKKNEEFFLIEKPCLMKLKNELEEEAFELEKRKNLKNENLNFLTRQIENNKNKRDLLNYEI